MLGKILRSMLMVAALGAALPASAAVSLFGYNFQSNSNSAENGAAGNSLSWMTTAGGTAIIVTATGWNATKATSGVNSGKYVISSAYLGQFAGGLGVTSAANDDLSYAGCGIGECNTHQIDNMGSNAYSSSIDFIRLTFSKPVTLGSVTRYAFGTANAGINGYDIDDDFSYGRTGTVANGMVVNDLSSIFTSSVVNAGGCAYDSNAGYCNDTSSLSTMAQATAASASQNWYIAAAIGNNYGGDGLVDGFKVASVNTYYVSGAVPEPGTWAMMLIGFGAIGVAMRRKGQGVALDFA